MLRISLIVVTAASLFAGNAGAATLVVDPSGGTDYLTIGAALSAADAGDVIEVLAGVYSEQLLITVPVTIRGVAGRLHTVLDGNDSFLPLQYRELGGGELEGFTIRHGYNPDAGAGLHVRQGSVLTVRDCLFENNHAGFDGGAFQVRHAGSRLTLDDCAFINNSAPHNGGAGNVILGAELTVTNCFFVQNQTETIAGALACNNSTMHVSGSLFQRNSTVNVAGAVFYYLSQGTTRFNTFHANTSPGGATVVVNSSPPVDVSHNIFSADTDGFGLHLLNSSGTTHTCNLYWANADGPINPSSMDPSEFASDPVFCNAPVGDFTISVGSPASGIVNSCGITAGAFAAICEQPVVIVPSSWGSVKASY